MLQIFQNLARIDFMHNTFFYLDEKNIYYEQDMSIASTILCAGIRDCRQKQVLQKPCSSFCMRGTGFACLQIIDGMVNQQECMRLKKEGFKVKWQTSNTLLENY